MPLHAHAPLSVEGRRRMVALIEGGLSQREAARRMGVSPATANRWARRFREATEQARTSLSCLLDRSSKPHHQPRHLSEDQEAPILTARRRTNLGPARIAHLVGRAPSTIWKVLKRHGLSRGATAPRPITKRYEWAEPGALIHIDTATLARFKAPGHRTRGRTAGTHVSEGMGHVVVHVAIDDHSRYAYVEQHADERADTCARFLDRALAHFRDLGLAPAEAVMSDGARNYRTARIFKDALLRNGAQAHRDPALHAQDQRQGGALHPDAEARVGLLT